MTPAHQIRRRREDGFTLFELLVTIAIIGVVSGLGLRAYSLAIDYYGLARSEGKTDKMAQSAMETMRADVSSVLPASLTGVSIVGTMANGPNGARDSNLVLPVSVPTMATGRYTAAQVQYHVQRVAGNARLMRTAVPLFQEIPDNVGTEVAAGVIAFQVEFLNEEGDWSEGWSSKSLPVAVRVSLTLREPDKITAPAITRSIVFKVPAQ